MSICSKCTHKNDCNMAEFGEVDSRITYCYKFKQYPQHTNADKYFRNATDEELAEFIANSTSCETCVVRKGGSDECQNTNCSTAWLEWLKKEV